MIVFDQLRATQAIRRQLQRTLKRVTIWLLVGGLLLLALAGYDIHQEAINGRHDAAERAAVHLNCYRTKKYSPKIILFITGAEVKLHYEPFPISELHQYLGELPKTCPQ